MPEAIPLNLKLIFPSFIRSLGKKEAFEERFGVKIMNTYGSTESIGWALTDPPVGKRNWPSVFRPGLGYEVRIADMNDEELPHGEVGEIQIKGVRGRSVMLEYFNNPKATEETFTEDGWLKQEIRDTRMTTVGFSLLTVNPIW